MDKIKIFKSTKMEQIEKSERMILELNRWSPGKELSKLLVSNIGEIKTNEDKNSRIKYLQDNIKGFREENRRDYGKKYISEIIEAENVVFGDNNLILAPVGSGKSTLILNNLIKEGKILYLVSNTTLKDSVCPNNNNKRQIKGNRMYTSQNKRKFGTGNYEIYVMTYAEFGGKIKYTDDFAIQFKQIHCDEIHSLPIYGEIDYSAELILATKYLFQKHAGQKKFYFTATEDGLSRLKKENVLKDVTTYNYLNHPEIRKYMTLSSYRINNLDQIRTHLEARFESFSYFGYKVLAFNRTIEGQLQIAEIAKDEGFKPITLWSVNNEEMKMSEEQIRVRDVLLETGKIPEPYNFLIINNAMQEGWDLKDSSVKLAIMNTTNETEKIQALGRLRNDLDILIYRVKKASEVDAFLHLPPFYYDKDLTSEMKDELCGTLNFKRNSKQIYKWTSIKKILTEQGYYIQEKTIKIDNKRVRVSRITTR